MSNSRHFDHASRMAAKVCPMRRIARRVASCRPAVNVILRGRDMGEGHACSTDGNSTPRQEEWMENDEAHHETTRETLVNDKVMVEEPLLTDLRARIRDVRVGPDGAVYVLTDSGTPTVSPNTPPASRLLKLTPK